MQQPSSPVEPPPSPTLTASQLSTLRKLGEERTAETGEVLYRVGEPVPLHRGAAVHGMAR
jgi:hypothetical protein